MTSENMQPQEEAKKPNDKEYNFRQLEAKYEKLLGEERQARLRAEQEAQKKVSSQHEDEEDGTDEPYVDHKRLDKKLNKFERKFDEKIDQKAEAKAKGLLEQYKREDWLKRNPDFYEVLQHAEKLANQDPELAETILQMPESFERQKLVYKNIKALNLHQAAKKEPSIQEKIDANRKSPYYQPTGIASPPAGIQGDFSVSGQKNAYTKMQELKQRMRI